MRITPGLSAWLPGVVLILVGLPLLAPAFAGYVGGAAAMQGIGPITAGLLGALAILGGVLSILAERHEIVLDPDKGEAVVASRGRRHVLALGEFDRVCAECLYDHDIDGLSRTLQVRLAGPRYSLVLQRSQRSGVGRIRQARAPQLALRVAEYLDLPLEDWCAARPERRLLQQLAGQTSHHVPPPPSQIGKRVRTAGGLLLVDGKDDQLTYDGTTLRFSHGMYPYGWFEASEASRRNAREAQLPQEHVIDLQFEIDMHQHRCLLVRMPDVAVQAFDDWDEDELTWLAAVLHEALAAAGDASESESAA